MQSRAEPVMLDYELSRLFVLGQSSRVKPCGLSPVEFCCGSIAKFRCDSLCLFTHSIVWMGSMAKS